MLTVTQINKIGSAKAAVLGVDLRLSKTQLTKQSRFSPFVIMLAGIAAPMTGKMLGFGQDDRRLQLPGTGRGLQLPGTDLGLQLSVTGRGREKKLPNSVGFPSSFEMRPFSNFDIEDLLKGIY